MTDAHAASVHNSAYSLATPYRDATCGELRADDAGRSVLIAGWVHRRRDHGQLIFLDLRDRYGITQVVVDSNESPAAHAVASKARGEFVLQIEGQVARRLAGTENAKLETGEIEVRARKVEILSEALTPPFYINEPDAPIEETVRLRYRYLDIRRRPLLERLLLRSELVRAIRESHHQAGFVEIETPILLKSTPEGARDFIVPSRLQPGSVYALPQSPQQLKQLLMVAGMDRYFQIARCFRDEDLRGDRQPEFTQLDLEMSFVTRRSRHGLRGGDDRRGQPCHDPGTADPADPVPALHLRRGNRAVRLGQARSALRHGAGRSRARARGGRAAAFGSSTRRSPPAGASRRSRPRAWPRPAAPRSKNSWQRRAGSGQRVWPTSLWAPTEPSTRRSPSSWARNGSPP